MIGYSDAVLLDLLSLCVAIALLVRYGRLGHSHPATIYLFFHVFSFSWRLYALSNGATPLFAEGNWGPLVEPMREEEMVRASLLADGVLLSMTAAWLWAARRYSGRPPSGAASWMGRPLNATIVRGVTWVTLPLGLAGLVLFARLPGVDNAANVAALGDWSLSSYVTILQSWAGLALIAIVYLRGFRWWLVALIVAYLGLMAYQGFHRYRAIIPSILLIQIYLDRRGMRWPNLRLTAVIVGLALAFFPLKDLGRAMQEDASLERLVDVASVSVVDAFSGQHADQLFLDELASALSLIDRAEARFYGAPYLAVLTLPVPRQLWPEKPTLNDFWRQIDSPSRPMFDSGMVMTFIGDLYLNFSYFGLFLMAPMLAFWLARLYFLSRAFGYWSIGHFAYLLLACNLLQVYRDGLISIVVFTMVNMLPLTAIVLLHVALSRLRPVSAPEGSA